MKVLRKALGAVYITIYY